MMHPDEGTLLALRDGEELSETDRAHVRACSDCSSALDEAWARRDAVDRLLELTGSEVDVVAAKAAVRARLDRNGNRRALPALSAGLRRAAVFVLLAAGAASALPSSPIRAWLTGAEQGPEPAPTATTTAAPAADTRTVEVPAVEGLVISVDGAEPGTPVSVVFEARGAVEVAAPEGARFQISDGRVGLDGVTGPVVVRAPSSAPALSVIVLGRVVFSGTAASAQVDANGVEADGGWVFRATGG